MFLTFPSSVTKLRSLGWLVLVQRSKIRCQRYELMVEYRKYVALKLNNKKVMHVQKKSRLDSIDKTTFALRDDILVNIIHYGL